MYDACKSMCDTMIDLGIAIDGGKDSLSMAAKVGDERVKCPGSLVITAYCGCVDIRDTVTPDLKGPALGVSSELLLVPLGVDGVFPLGGSALAQTCGQVRALTHSE